MTDNEDVGAFVCSCAGTCNVDLERARERVEDVAFAASSDLLCGDDTVEDVAGLVEERDIQELIATCPAQVGQERLERVEEETDVSLSFVDQREGAGWIHSEDEATEKTARLVNAARARIDGDSSKEKVDVGNEVAVVGDAELATALPDSADVTLVADGDDFSDTDLDGIRLERGRIVDISGSLGGFRVTVESHVTEDCVDCMDCVHAGPEGKVTSEPVDISVDAPDGDWTDVCPTDAIDLSGVRRELSFDQVVYPDGEDGAEGGTAGLHVDGDLSTVSSVVDHLREREIHLDLTMDVCASGASGQEGCTACYEACPHDAVEKPAADEVAFDLAACENCGACTSECPTGAVELVDRPNETVAREVEALVDDEPSGGLLGGGKAIQKQVVAFVCSEKAEDALRRYGREARRDDGDGYPPLLPVSVNCTDTVGEAHVLHALAVGADGVAIVGCGSDCLHSGPEPKTRLVERLNTATTDLGLGERVGFFAPESLEEFADRVAGFVGGLSPTPVPPDGHEASGSVLPSGDELPMHDDRLPEYANRAWLLESVRAVLENTEPERREIRGLEGFGVVSVNDDCALTPTCTNLCPTGALRRDDGALEFRHDRCVNCGLCETGCPESAITVETGLDTDLLPENSDGPWTTVYEDEPFECRRCGDVFTSASTVEKMKEEIPDADVEGVDGHIAEYCTDCKGELSFQI